MLRRPRPGEDGCLREPTAIDPASLGPKAENYALDLLALRQRTTREMESKLRAKGYPEEIIEELVSRLVRVGYLDDRRFAVSWVEERIRTRPSGRMLLRVELSRKGVGPNIIAEVLREILPPEAEEEAALRAARKWASRLSRGGAAADDPGAKERLWGFLRRRGFGAGACQRAMRSVWSDFEMAPRDDEEPPTAEDARLDQPLLCDGAARGLTSPEAKG